MNFYPSELDIPEFDTVPHKEARRIWRSLYLGNKGWFNLTILIGPFCGSLGAALAAFWLGTQTAALVGGLLGMSLGHEIHRQVMIRHLRPKIRNHLARQT